MTQKLRTIAVAFLLLTLLPNPFITRPVAAVEVPTAGAAVYLQTNGPTGDIGLGDWYTSTANGSAAGYHYLQITIPCEWPSGTPIYFDLFSPEMNRSNLTSDEPSAAAAGASYQPTTFELYAPGTIVGPAPNLPAPGGSLISTTYPAPAAPAPPEAWVRFHTLTSPITCGNYILRAQSGNGDQNSWRLRVGTDNDADPNNAPPANYDNPDGTPGTNDEIVTGINQTSYQHNVAGGTCYTLYQYVEPNRASVTFHNFDMDGNQRVRYYAPSVPYDATANTGGVVGTVSGGSVWNGGTTTSRGTGDVLANPESGWWKLVSCLDSNNQFIQEGQVGKPVYYAQPPTPQIATTKTDGQTSAIPGGTLTYTIGYTNASDQTATPGAALGLTFTDTLPTNTTYVGCAVTTGPAGTCSQSGGVVTYTISETVDAGASGTVTLTVQLAANAPAGALTNTVTANYSDAIGNTFTGQATDTNTVTAPSSLAGSVYLDADNSGTRASGEAGIAGVTITLTGTDANGTPVTLTTTTATDGTYSFPNLLPGTYAITETQPTGYTDGSDTSGSAGGSTAVNDAITGIVLPAGSEATGYLFGERPAGLSGTVYRDVNRNGTRDVGDVGLGGVTITVTGTDTNGTPVNRTTTTAADGSYSFPDILAGTYTLTETQPTGYGSSTPNTLTVTVPVGGLAGQNFGETAGTIGGTVYADTDNDGLLDPGEPGIAGVTVTLVGTDAGGNPVSRTTTTAADGSYTFDGLLAGTYAITETQPAGYGDGRETAGNAGGNTTANDTIAGITLAAGAIGSGYTFGEIRQASPSPSPSGSPSPTPSPSPSPSGSPSPRPTPTPRPSPTPEPEPEITTTDLIVTKAGPATVTLGQPFVYTITVTNNGPGNAFGATLVDDVPAAITGVAWTCASAGQSACGTGSGGGNGIRITFTLRPGPENQIVLTVASTAGSPGTVVNSATATPQGGMTELTPRNNTATATTQVVGPSPSPSPTPAPSGRPTPGASPSATPTPPPSPAPVREPDIQKVSNRSTAEIGQEITFTITVSNPNSIPVEDLVITDDVPPQFAITNVATTRGTATSNGQLMTATVGTLPPGASVTVTITATVLTGSDAPIVNTARYTGTLAGKPVARTAMTAVGTPNLPNTGGGGMADDRRSPLLPLGVALLAGAMLAAGYRRYWRHERRGR